MRATRKCAVAALVALCAGTGLTAYNAGHPTRHAGKFLNVSSSTVVTEQSLGPGYITAGVNVQGTVTLQASSPVTASAVVVAVRDSQGRNVDFPGAVTNVALNSTPRTFTTGARSLPVGTYTEFGSWRDTAGAWHPLPVARLVAGAQPPSTPAPSPNVTSSPTPPPSPSPTPTPTSSATPALLDDEFNGAALNTAAWQPGWFGTGSTGPVDSGETACYATAHATLGGGSLSLAVDNTPSTCQGVTRPHTGALVSTNPHDGRASGGFEVTGPATITARVWLPGSPIANWPAVWATGQNWPVTGEDDIVEGLDGQACWHVHTSAGGPGGCAPSGQFAGWHTFSSVWNGSTMTFLYDGVQVGSEPFSTGNAPLYLVLDNTTSQSGAITPSTMQIDWIRVTRP